MQNEKKLNYHHKDRYINNENNEKLEICHFLTIFQELSEVFTKFLMQA